MTFCSGAPYVCVCVWIIHTASLHVRQQAERGERGGVCFICMLLPVCQQHTGGAPRWPGLMDRRADCLLHRWLRSASRSFTPSTWGIKPCNTEGPVFILMGYNTSVQTIPTSHRCVQCWRQSVRFLHFCGNQRKVKPGRLM